MKLNAFEATLPLTMNKEALKKSVQEALNAVNSAETHVVVVAVVVHVTIMVLDRPTWTILTLSFLLLLLLQHYQAQIL